MLMNCDRIEVAWVLEIEAWSQTYLSDIEKREFKVNKSLKNSSK
jgi:hypothetical protein